MREARTPFSIGRRRLRIASFAAVTVAYLLAGGALVALSRDQINPDAISYALAGRNYAAGRFDLAVNSWFGPLLSWLLTPAAPLGLEAMLLAKALAVLSGLGFAWAVVSLVKRLTAGDGEPGRASLPAYAAALMLVLPMLPEPITPDVLLAALTTWYLARTAGLIHTATARRAFSAGLIGGVAFLAKAYALPFVMVHLAMTFLLHRQHQRKTGRGESSLKPLLAGAAGVLLLALPWIAVISAHDGRPTFNSAGQRGSRSFGPIARTRPWPMLALQRPRPGRVTCWEDPTEIEGDWPTWSVFDGAEGLGKQWICLRHNSREALMILAGADGLGLLLAGGAAAVLLSLPIRGNRSNRRCAGRGWACLSIALYAGGYLLIFVEPRYLWPIFGVLLALTVVVLDAAAAATAQPGRARLARTFRAAVAALLIASLVVPVAGTFRKWRYIYGPHGRTAWLRRAAGEVPLTGPLAGNKWYETLNHAYRGGGVLLGQVDGRDPADVAEKLGPFAPAHVLIFDDVELAGRFARHPAFTPAGKSIRKETGESLHAFAYAGGRADP